MINGKSVQNLNLSKQTHQTTANKKSPLELIKINLVAWRLNWLPRWIENCNILSLRWRSENAVHSCSVSAPLSIYAYFKYFIWIIICFFVFWDDIWINLVRGELDFFLLRLSYYITTRTSHKWNLYPFVVGSSLFWFAVFVFYYLIYFICDLC